MRSAAIAFAVTLLLGLGAVAAVGATQGSGLVYSPGVNPVTPMVDLQPGQRACQGPLQPPDGASFDRVAVTLGTFGRPGPPVRVEVMEGTDRRIADGRLAGGYPDVDRAPEQVIEVGQVQTQAPLFVCFVNEGTRPVALFGQIGVASPATSGTVDGAPVDADFALELRSEERSLLALLPDMAERASRFRAGWVSAGLLLALWLAVLIAAPLLLARGLGRAAEADGDASAAEPDARSAATTQVQART
jgi:hypothetical protein